MKQGLICAEGELSTAANTLERYVDFLVGSIDEYCEIISGIITSKQIQDELITAELQNLAEKISREKASLDKIKNNIKAIVNKEISEIEAVDRFDYPEMSWNDVKSLLMSFF